MAYICVKLQYEMRNAIIAAFFCLATMAGRAQQPGSGTTSSGSGTPAATGNAAPATGGTMTAAPTLKFTLEDCLRYALDANFRRQRLKLSENAAAESYDQSRAERLPSVNASLSENYSNSKARPNNFNGNYGVNAGMTLWQGGAINDAIEQARLQKEQSTLNTSQYDNTLVINILQAFLTVLGNEELLKYQQAVVDASAQQVKQGASQLKAGTILESDYLLLQAQYASDQYNIAGTRMGRDVSLLTLKNLLAMDINQKLEVVYPDTSALRSMSAMPSMGEVLDRARETLPDLKISQYNVDLADNAVKMARTGYYPTLSLNAGLGTGHVQNYDSFGNQLHDQFSQSAGLTLSVPIFNNLRTRSNVYQRNIALQQAQLDQKQTQLDAMQNVATEYMDVMSSYQKFRTDDIRRNAYLRSFEAFGARFDAGSITVVDLLQQQNNYIGALNDYIQSKYGFMLKRKVLDVYMGVPVTM